MNVMTRTGTAVGLVAMGMSFALAVPASATTSGGRDGLVNVNVGDVNVARDVNVGAVVPIVANLCGINLAVPANVAVLSAAAQNVDATGKSYTVCKAGSGAVKIVQN